jgi:hypothetical protein
VFLSFNERPSHLFDCGAFTLTRVKIVRVTKSKKNLYNFHTLLPFSSSDWI